MTRFMLYGIAALLFLGGLVAFFDKSQINAVRELVGFAPLHVSEASSLSKKETEAEMARLAAEPLPGIVDDAPSLGEAADAAVVCTAKVAKFEPRRPARAALRRYLLNLAAIGIDRKPPLVEPRLRVLRPLIGQGPMAVLDMAAKGEIGPAERDFLARYHAKYSDPEHPLYKGIELHAGTFDALEFERVTGVASGNWAAIAECTEAAILPGLVDWRRLTVEN